MLWPKEISIFRFRSIWSPFSVVQLPQRVGTPTEKHFVEKLTNSFNFFLGFNQKRYFTGLSVRSFCQQEKERWADLSYEQLNALIESRDIILIDVREPKEIEALGKISDSINIPRKFLLLSISLIPLVPIVFSLSLKTCPL